MPIHPDYQNEYNSMIKKYGKKKGEEVFYATMNKNKADYTKPRPKSKEFKVANTKLNFKEIKEEFYSNGYIATTHIDSAGDKILPETLGQWAEEINNSVENSFQANPTSIHHDRDDPNLAGLGIVATVETMPENEYGLRVDTHHNKAHPDFENTKYELENNFLTHYSIEYDTQDGATTHYEIDPNSKAKIRIIEPGTKLLGFGLASPRTVVNKNAKILNAGYKELIKLSEKEAKEEVKMPEEKPAEAPAPAEDVQETPEEPAEEAVEEKETKEEVKEKIKKEIKEKVKEKAPLVKQGKKMEVKEKLEVKELELKETLTQFKEGVLQGKATIDEQWRIAAKVEKQYKERGMRILNGDENTATPFEIKEVKLPSFEGGKEFPSINKRNIQVKELELKGVTTDTDYMGAQSTFVTALANYEQTPARYNDIYGPVIVNQMNDETTTWNLFKKENMSGMSAIRIRARTAANATAGTYGYGSTPGWDSNVTFRKYNLQFITSYVEVQAEDEAIEFGNGQGGIDVYANEIKYSTKDLMTYLNVGIYGTGDGTLETAPLGLDGGAIKTSGNLYGKDVASDLNLAAAGADDMSSAKITLTKMREMIRKCVIKGARIGDLAFFTSYLQHDFIKSLIQDMQRIVPTSARVGFTGILELDGVPVYPDKDLDAQSMTDDLFLIDTSVTKIAIKKAPTYVEFGKVSLHRRGIVWMMWNLFVDSPSHNYHTYGLAIS